MYKLRSASPIATVISVFVGIAALAGCAPPKPTLHTDYDREANFSNYHTYMYVNPVGTDKAGYSSLITQHFKTAIDTEMSARGYRKVDADPDLLVNFMANAHEKTDIRSTPSSSVTMGMGYYGYRGGMYAGMPVYSSSDVETVRYKVGTANIDVVDAHQKKLIWTGVAEGRLSDEAMANPQPAIANVVTQMFTAFPGRAAPAN
jgi:uncharacterized protein DUF4136